MTENTNTTEQSRVAADCPNERLVMLPPYVAPEHRRLIESAETVLREYEEYLLSKIKSEVFEYGWTMNPHPEDIRKAEQRFHSDQIRMHLITNLANIKALCERPRFRKWPMLGGWRQNNSMSD